MKRIIFVLIGIALIGLDVWLYFKAESDGGIFLLLFGIGSAIAIPIGVGLITYAFGEKHREAVRKLTKVPEIDELIARAETQEQEIEIMREEYAKLQATIQSESERLALTTSKDNLERDAKRILEELNCIESELRAFDESVVKGVPAEEVRKLRERVQAKRRGDIIIRIGRSQYVIEREVVIHTPFFGFWLYTLLKFWQDLDTYMLRRRRYKPPH